MFRILGVGDRCMMGSDDDGLIYLVWPLIIIIALCFYPGLQNSGFYTGVVISAPVASERPRLAVYGVLTANLANGSRLVPDSSADALMH